MPAKARGLEQDMKKITYKITNPLGIHARPAGFLVKQISSYKSKIVIEKDGKEVDAKRIIALMSLGVKQGDNITLTFDGEDEEAASIATDKFLKENL